MSEAMTRARDEGVRHVVFGDLFLEDIRAYREKQLAACDDDAECFRFGAATRGSLLKKCWQAGCRHISLVLTRQSSIRAFAGRRFDVEFLEALPPGVDPCGENGEFHTFA